MASKPNLFTDRAFLLTRQCRDASNLSARVDLHRRSSTNREAWPRWLFEAIIGPHDGEVVLEVGCGAGDLWHENQDRLPAASFTLTDLSIGMIEESRSRLPRSWHYASVDAQSLPFRDASFDVVVANHMLYHVPNRDKAIAELRRVLRSRGRLIAATNGRAHLKELDELMERFLGSRRGHDDAEKFGPETGLAQLERHFARVEVTRHESRLLVIETEALVRYILSVEDDVSEEAIEALREHVDRVIAARGHYEIAKDAGVLIAFA